MADTSFNNKAANLWVSRIIPLILVGIVGYATWVVVVLLCVNYLLHPPPETPKARHGAGITIIVLYAILLLLMGLCYFRLVYTVTANPGFVPQNPHLHAKQEKRATTRRKHREPRKDTDSQSSPKKYREKDSLGGVGGRSFAGGAYADGEFNAPTTNRPAPSLQEFYSRDAFVCQGDGRPMWCTKCEIWKPDRAHHCRESERCVKKMDHFCPWVGGVVSETSFKFFTQFVSWGAIYCIFNLIVMAYYLAEDRRENHNLNVHWLVTLCCGGLFGLFSVGMAGSSFQFVFINSTTIENLSRKTIVWTLALYVPEPLQESPGFRTISFSSAQNASSTEHNSNVIRTFAILHTKPGENPFDLGPFNNFRSVMGDHWYDWLLPLRYSPCCDHDRQDSQFAMGPVVDRLRKEAGIASPAGLEDEKPHRKHRRRRRHRSDAGKPDQLAIEELHVTNDGPGFQAGEGGPEVDLESGLGHTNGSVR